MIVSSSLEPSDACIEKGGKGIIANGTLVYPLLKARALHTISSVTGGQTEI